MSLLKITEGKSTNVVRSISVSVSCVRTVRAEAPEGRVNDREADGGIK